MPFDERYKDLNVEAIHLVLDPYTMKVLDVQIDGIQYDGTRTWLLCHCRGKITIDCAVADPDS